ncbi:MAG: FAD-binding protein [Bacteroidetes bacterium]|nr:FAD-binding protein [Bacteroidota bacterium]
MYTFEISLLPHQVVDETYIKSAIQAELKNRKITLSDFVYKIHKQSIDARRKPIIYRLQVHVFSSEEFKEEVFKLEPTILRNHIVIVGAGPAGLFAALKCLELGVKPIVIERGKDVKSRRRDLAQITKMLIVNGESNYCFGEGGAGTYSDGKLYTRSGKRGSIDRILNIFVKFGADPKILYEAHPHIGTNKLPEIIVNIRNYIIEHGGEVRFESKLTDIQIENKEVKSVIVNASDEIRTSAVVLATGHSARDIFELLHSKKILVEAKPFALGVRIEHPQALIDSIQYKCDIRGAYLPPASYSLVEQVKGRGVFSFCMCPGGIIAPAATQPGEVVVNGWSPSKRNNKFANSGMVVSVGEEDFKPYEKYGALSAMHYQKSVEQLCFIKSGNTIQAPAQRLTDFLQNKSSSNLPDCSYLPGVNAINMNDVLPKEIYTRLREGLSEMGKKMRGYVTEDAILVATESRTSSPVKIPRDKETHEHPEVKGLFPCGEGAGYAGGIVSAAIDGENTVQKITRLVFDY